MPIFLNAVTFLIMVGLGVVAFGVQLRALLDCVRAPAADFQRVYKRTKMFWGGLTGASAFLGFIYLIGPISTSLTFNTFVPPATGMSLLLNLAGLTVAGVYLADVRPALAEVRGYGNGRQNRGTSW